MAPTYSHPQPIPAHLLSNGDYSVVLTAGGTGMSAFHGAAISRWLPDAVGDRYGFFFYLKDLKTGAVWSATASPVPAAAGARHTISNRFRPERVLLTRRTHEVEATVEVVVAASAAAELRRLTLVNHGVGTCRLAVTTWLELVLASPALDAAHPALARLFVQTGFDPRREALLARRRARRPGEQPLWVGHSLTGPAPLGFETERARFIGRGRNAAAPLALRSPEPLSGTFGNVLDAGFALQREFAIRPGERARCYAVLAAAHDRAMLEAALDRFSHEASLESAFLHPGVAAGTRAEAMLGIPAGWLQRLQLGSDAHEPVPHPAPTVIRLQPAAVACAASPEPLRFFNGHGGFNEAGDEYVIRMPVSGGRAMVPPLPWCNVLANEHAGCLVSESGAGCTWVLNSRENRLTPWSNDPVSDPPGDAVYVRDEETGEFWTLTPRPAPLVGGYEARHGFGYTKFCHLGTELQQELCIFVPRGRPVRVARVRLTNHGERPRRLSLWCLAPLVLGRMPVETRGDVSVQYDPERDILVARNPERGEFSGRLAFSALIVAGAEASTWSADRAAFLGEAGTPAAPAALLQPYGLDRRLGADACFAHHCTLVLPPGGSADAVLLLGEGADDAEVTATLEALGSAAAADAALDDVVHHWRTLLGRVRVETPVPELDLLANGWLAYQVMSCRLHARCGFSEPGALGFREQLQDAAALVYLDPAVARNQLLVHAAHQFVEGDVLHRWQPPQGMGVRSRSSDDRLWLPAMAAFYIGVTGDAALLDEPVDFLRAPPLEPGEDERVLVPAGAGEPATFYEHCCRAVDSSLPTGAHGLPLLGSGDWNETLNRVSREGRGESVWLGFFLFDVLRRFTPWCERRGDRDRAERYRAHGTALGNALNVAGWDGEWYRRAFYDDGTPLGSAADEECRIEASAQAWAVISGAAPPDRAAQALDAVERHLVSEDEGIIRMFAPPFDRAERDPGDVKACIPGARENGGHHTHAALWAVRAFLELGRREIGTRLLRLLSPVSHGRSAEEIARYRGEPYAVAADLYAVAPHVGRAGWTWYTGAAGCFYRVLLENLLGLELRAGRELVLRPCIPDEWQGFTVHFTAPAGGVYLVKVNRNGDALTRAELDGVPLPVRDGAVHIPVHAAGAHSVAVALGPDIVRAYRCQLALLPGMSA